MKIGLIATSIWNTIHLDQAKALQQLGHRVVIYTEDNRASSGMRFTRLEEDGLEFYVIHGFRRNPWTWLPDRLLKPLLGRRFFTTLVAIWRFVRLQRDCDIFIVEGDWLGFFVGIIGKFERFRWVVGIHDTDYLDVPIEFVGRPESRWKTWVKRWVLEQAERVRANSFVTRDFLVAGGCPAQKVDVVPLHYLPKRMLPQCDDLATFRSEARQEVFARHQLPPDTLLLVTMCRLVPVKGLDRLIRALPKVLAAEPRARVMICGGDRKVATLGSMRDYLAKVAAECGVTAQVIFAGEVELLEVKRYLAAANLHLAPSVVDTFNYGVIEAALVGTFSITSSTVGATPWAAPAAEVVDCAAEPLAASILARLHAPPAAADLTIARQRILTELAPKVIAAQGFGTIATPLSP